MALWWGAEVITAPTWRNLDSSFESWAYRSGFSSRLDYLEREQFLEKRRGADAAKCAPDVQMFAVFEGRPRSGATDEEIVSGAWDFEEIDRNYGDYIAHLKKAPTRGDKTATAPDALRGWIHQENQIWRRAVRIDPLLPNQLLPKGYRGRVAWKRRREVWKRIGSRMRNCHPA